MFASVLLPFAERGAGPVHHWVMLAQMARFSPEEIVFLGDRACFDEAAVPFGEWLKVGGLRFRSPTREQFLSYRRIVLDDALAGTLAAASGGHLGLFKRLLLERILELEEAFYHALLPFRDRLEMVLAWSNCPSLRAALERLGDVPLVHNEIGPLRSPLYRETFYFDFRGVNGNTTPAGWDPAEVRAQMQGARLLSPDEVRGLLVADLARVQSMEPARPDHRIGVALQVEDDSNTVAYANGWSSLELLYDAMGRVGPDGVLVRSHPDARFRYGGGLGHPDDSPDSLAFLARVDEVVSINSSVLVEAAFWGRRFEVKGDSPVRFLARAGEGEDWDVLAFNAFFLAYLVPSELLFDPDYYRWRLTRPSLAECHARHLQVLASRGTTAVAALPGAGAVSSGGLVRLPAIWTSTLGLERRVAELSHRAEAADAAAGRWQGEARRFWDELIWFKQEHARLSGELAAAQLGHEGLENLQSKLGALHATSEALQALLQELSPVLLDKLERVEGLVHERFEGLQSTLGALRATSDALQAQQQDLSPMLLDKLERVEGLVHERFEGLQSTLGALRATSDALQAQQQDLSPVLLDKLERVEGLVHERFEGLQSTLEALRATSDVLQIRLQERPPTLSEKFKRLFRRTL